MLPQRSFGTATVTLWGRHGFSDHRPCDWLFKVHSSHNENIKFYNTLTLVSKIGCWRVDCPKRGPQVNAPVMQGSFPCHNSFMRLQVCIQNDILNFWRQIRLWANKPFYRLHHIYVLPIEYRSAAFSYHDDFIKWSPVNSPHKGQWHEALKFSLICAWTNVWIHYHEADFRRHGTHYDVTVMCLPVRLFSICYIHCYIPNRHTKT